MSCPSEEQIARYVLGQLPESTRRELEDHAGNCEPCQRLLSALSTGLLDGSEAAAPGPPLVWEAGCTVGRYVVLKPLGEGGMGVVALAYDPELDRKVALKLIHPRLWAAKGEPAREHLRREAMAMAKLNHPNVVSVYDVGTHEDQLFVAMEYVDGVTLNVWLAQKPRSWRRVLAMCLEAGKGLVAAHEADLVHRDFKPQNVLVSRGGRVLVTDFGLVQLAQPRLIPADSDEVGPGSRSAQEARIAREAQIARETQITREAQITRAGNLIGTPAYMAPEQHRGEATDHRSDQFSFAVTVYEALYGAHPFGEPTAATLSDAICHAPVRHAPSKSRGSGRVRRVLLKGLAKDPEERYASVALLLSGLARAKGAPRWALGVLAGLVLLLGGLGAILFWPSPEFTPDLCSSQAALLQELWNPARERALRRAFLATGQPYARDAADRVIAILEAYARGWIATWQQICRAGLEGRQNRELLETRLHCLEQRRQEFEAVVQVLLAQSKGDMVFHGVELATGLTRLTSCDASKVAAVALPKDPKSRARLLTLRGQLERIKAFAKAGSYDHALLQVKSLRSSAAALGYAPLQAEVSYWMGMVQMHTGATAAAIQSYKECFRQATAAKHRPIAAWSALQLSFLLGQKQWSVGETWISRAQTVIQRMSAPNELQAMLLSYRSLLHQAQGQYARAEQSGRRALVLLGQVSGPAYHQEAILTYNLATVLLARNKLEPARLRFARALALQKASLGHSHPQVAETLAALGEVQRRQGNYTKAAQRFRRALALKERNLGPSHAGLLAPLIGLGVTLGGLGKPNEAVRLHRRALAIWQKQDASSHPYLAYLAALHNNLGSALYSAGDLKAASQHLHRALQMREELLGANHPTLAVSLTNVGVLLTEQRKVKAARAHFLRALKIVQARPSHRAQQALILANLGTLLRKTGQLTEALRRLQRARVIREQVLGPRHPAMATIWVEIGHVRLARQMYQSAIASYGKAIALLRGVGHQRHLAEGYFGLAQARWSIGQRVRALAAARKGQGLYQRLGLANRRVQVEAWLRQRGGRN